MSSSWLYDIPNETLIHILSYASECDLMHLHLVSRMMNEVSSSNPLWRALCVQHWGWDVHSNSHAEDTSTYWKDVYTDIAHNQGMYRHKTIYRRVHQVWERIERWTKVFAPLVYSTLAPPCTEENVEQCLASLSSRNLAPLPLEVQCSSRIHDGQIPERSLRNIHGLLGGFSVYDLHVNFILCSISTGTYLTHHQWKNNCFLLAFNQERPIVGLWIVLREFSQWGRTYAVGEVVQCAANGISCLPAYSSYIEVLEQHANSLEGGRHDVIDGEIIQFPTFASEGSDCTTHGIQVRANGLFVSVESGNIVFHAQGTQYVPESGIFTFAYRIRISMDVNVPATQAAQLVSRHWEIIDESNGSMEVVDGEGVIGHFPTMKPGAYPFSFQLLVLPLALLNQT
eukprot:TRINITY_DN3771_c0_g1_i9.p1 TRINITY_DN3771_c0_g1~~TRINITY_DN3771_c0_g1_i9.p1  ORF type:complete len:397 (-),score=-9.07 TRINITY_DN3771_c0_g1_i9:19-1209(-)